MHTEKTLKILITIIIFGYIALLFADAYMARLRDQGVLSHNQHIYDR